jgi:hypothetical protein
MIQGRYNRLTPLPMRQISCARCQTPVTTRSSLRKYCDECIRLIKIEAAAKRRARRQVQ